MKKGIMIAVAGILILVLFFIANRWAVGDSFRKPAFGSIPAAASNNASAGNVRRISAAGASSVDTRILVQNLDKVTDETIRYINENCPQKIKVYCVTEGDFTGSGKPELLVIFKLLDMPHAGGLDSSVAAVYDRDSLGLVTQKTFQYDECGFKALRDEAGRGYLLFVGSATYQGNSTYSIGLWRLGRTWTDLFVPDVSMENNKKYELTENGNVRVLRPTFDNPLSQEITWLHEYDLVWNKVTGKLDVTIPATYRSERGTPNIDPVSTSPDGRYAIATIPDQRRVLLYDLRNNSLSDDMEMLAQDYGFLWSQDSSRVCVIRTARIWIESSIITAGSNEITDLPSAGDIWRALEGSGTKPDYVLSDSRPDPYVTPIEWSPDGNRLLMFYQWTDNRYNRQSGTFVFDVLSGGMSRFTYNKVYMEGGHVPATKPVGFQW